MIEAQVWVFVILATCFLCINNLEVIPEAVKIVYFNPKYVANMSGNVRRYGRNSPYVINGEGVVLRTFGENVTFDFIFYEYLHNEYRQSFVELHLKGCKSIVNDRILQMGAILKEKNVTCPLLPGHYVLSNMTFKNIPEVDNSRYKWPFKKAKVVATTRTYPERVKIVESYAILSFKDGAPKARRKTS